MFGFKFQPENWFFQIASSSQSFGLKNKETLGKKHTWPSDKSTPPTPCNMEHHGTMETRKCSKDMKPPTCGPLPLINGVTGVITPISGVVTPFATRKGPPCMHFLLGDSTPMCFDTWTSPPEDFVTPGWVVFSFEKSRRNRQVGEGVQRWVFEYMGGPPKIIGKTP